MDPTLMMMYEDELATSYSGRNFNKKQESRHNGGKFRNNAKNEGSKSRNGKHNQNSILSSRVNCDRRYNTRNKNANQKDRNNENSKQSTSKGNRKFVIAKSCIEAPLHVWNDNSNVGDRIFIGIKYLSERLSQDPFKVLFEVLSPDSGLQAFLDEPSLASHALVHVIQLIKQLCSVNLTESKSELLNRVCRSRALSSVSNYLHKVQYEINVEVIGKLDLFIVNLEVIFVEIVDTCPKLACEIDLKKLIKKTLRAIQVISEIFNSRIDEIYGRRFQHLIQNINDLQKSFEKSQSSFSANFNTGFIPEKNIYEEKDPPQNFRELDLYPTSSELKQQSFSFLRENRVTGGYNNVEHYLDVQFRLLREDFVDPLRRGIQEYVAVKFQHDSKHRRNRPKLKNKYDSIRLYQKTTFQSVDLTGNNQVGVVLNLNLNPKLKIKWESNKRFMCGSLLLFTTDDFKTFFYGTILNRDTNQLEKGLILVRLQDDISINAALFKQKFLMAESEVFFEPYFLVMKAFKTLKEDNFPMSQYIVYGKKTSKMPSYITTKFHAWDILGHRLVPGQLHNWPSPAALKLNPSQHDALKTALTSDFCIIQGPPGTGKTFLGLKIVEVLLKNKALNEGAINTPILVVCCTNHALDQFLEGILKHTENIIRAGSQSKSKDLQNFNLRGHQTINLRKEARRMYHQSRQKVQTIVNESIEKIQRWTNLSQQLGTSTGIVSHDYISLVMTDRQKSQIPSDEALWNWLLISDAPQKYRREIQEFLSKEGERRARESDVEQEMSDSSDEDEEDKEEDEGLYEEPVNTTIFAQPTFPKPFYKTVEDVRKEHNAIDRCHKNFRMQFDSKQRELGILIAVSTTPGYDRKKSEYSESCNIYSLNFLQRCNLYWHWIDKLHQYIIDQINDAQKQYNTVKSKYEEYKAIEDLYVVRNADVLGMTTTCAARLHILLGALKPNIVFIEEAAEVLESHIVISLTKKCEHVILIGDHKQLRPSTATYELSKDFKFDVSLFERIVNNGMYCPILNIQHRMRPEISSLITPLIYPDLRSHDDVRKYEAVRGMRKNLYFIEHNHFETQENDSTSRSNPFEAKYALELCKYLILQGYDQEKITILTTYSGQMLLLRKEKKKSSFAALLKNVRCIVVDKYQGEENDIIILSLVRSNPSNIIGFLNIENRVCVALSRARKGFYLIGNMNNLSRNSEMWKKIKEILTNQNAIGKDLKLYCRKHDEETIIFQLNDFKKVEGGGCQRLCGDRMNCGHTCYRACNHQTDREHTFSQCKEKCLETYLNKETQQQILQVKKNVPNLIRRAKNLWNSFLSLLCSGFDYLRRYIC